jgi:hypothetical protein
VLSQIARCIDDECRMQQRFRRNAADIQTNTAKHRPAVDKDRSRAEVRSPEGR